MNLTSCDFKITVPGRVNLIGEHTDYNGLPVLPMAIEPALTLTGSRRYDNTVRVWKTDGERECVDFILSPPISSHPRGHWINYLKAGMQGVLDELSPEDITGLRGCDLVISSTLPQGIGLASSSALVVASALALLQANRRSVNLLELAERMAEAEHYVGTRGGGMDQAVCLLGKKNHLLKIDFFPLRFKEAPLPESVTVVICDSLVRAKKTENALQAYNLRAVECRFASLLLKAALERNHHPDPFTRLGDLLQPPWNFSYNDLKRFIQEELREVYTYSEIVSTLRDENRLRAILQDHSFTEETQYSNMVFACGKRFRHVIGDAARVEQSVKYLRQEDVVSFGKLMNEAHTCARNEFEISCPQLDRLVELGRANGALGARLTGAGFGGCTVNLVRRQDASRFMNRMFEQYYKSAGSNFVPAEVIFMSNPANGAVIHEYKRFE